MIIWLDDLRDPKDYGYPDALWVKNSQEFMEFLNSDSNPHRCVTGWHFDNDLGEGSDQDGYACFLALEEKIVFDDWIHGPIRIFVHTSNPSAGHKFMLAKESMSQYGVTILRNNY